MRFYAKIMIIYLKTKTSSELRRRELGDNDTIEPFVQECSYEHW